MKRVLLAVMVAMMIFCCISVVHAIDYVTDADVNVRDPKTHESLKNQSGSSIVIRRWNIVNVIDDSDKFWLLIRMPDGREGIIYKEYAHIGHSEELEEIQNRQKQGIKITNEDAILIGRVKEDCKVFKKANGKQIGDFYAGEEVYIRQTGKYWSKIVWQDKEIGFVQTKNIQLVDANIPGEGVVCMLKDSEGKHTKFILRVEPTPDAESLWILKEGTYVRVLNEEPYNGYVKVACSSSGDIGYIREKYLKEVKIFED